MVNTILKIYFVIMTLVSVLDILFCSVELRAEKENLSFFQCFTYIIAILCGVGGSYTFAFLAFKL